MVASCTGRPAEKARRQAAPKGRAAPLGSSAPPTARRPSGRTASGQATVRRPAAAQGTTRPSPRGLTFRMEPTTAGQSSGRQATRPAASPAFPRRLRPTRRSGAPPRSPGPCPARSRERTERRSRRFRRSTRVSTTDPGQRPGRPDRPNHIVMRWATPRQAGATAGQRRRSSSPDQQLSRVDQRDASSCRPRSMPREWG